jgi:hypothetical protein
MQCIVIGWICDSMLIVDILYLFSREIRNLFIVDTGYIL